MKIAQQQLKRIIKEEVQAVLKETGGGLSPEQIDRGVKWVAQHRDSDNDPKVVRDFLSRLSPEQMKFILARADEYEFEKPKPFDAEPMSGGVTTDVDIATQAEPALAVRWYALDREVERDLIATGRRPAPSAGHPARPIAVGGLPLKEFERWETVVKSGIQKVTGQIDKERLNAYFGKVLRDPVFKGKLLKVAHRGTIDELEVVTPYRAGTVQMQAMKAASKIVSDGPEREHAGLLDMPAGSTTGGHPVKLPKGHPLKQRL